MHILASISNGLINLVWNKTSSVLKKLYENVALNFMYVQLYEVQRKIYSSNSYSILKFCYMANYARIKIN